jgi:hypothetical protein
MTASGWLTRSGRVRPHGLVGRGSARAAALDVTLPFGNVTRRGSWQFLAFSSTSTSKKNLFRISLYTNAPLQEDPQPAVHPKQ